MKNFSYKYILMLLILFIITFLSLPAVAVEDNRESNQNSLTEEQNIFEGNRSPSFDSLVPPSIIGSGEGPDFSFPGSVEFPGFLNPFQAMEEENNIFYGAFVYQIGNENIANINQVGIKNLALIYQDGTGNLGNMYQSGEENSAIIAQLSSLNEAGIYQQGNNNTANIIQEVDECVAAIIQEGNGNEADIFQRENSSESTKKGILQIGDNNKASTDSFDRDISFVIEQIGNNMNLDVDGIIVN